MTPSSPPAQPTHGRPIGTVDPATGRMRDLGVGGTVDVGVVMVLLDLLWWIR